LNHFNFGTGTLDGTQREAGLRVDGTYRQQEKERWRVDDDWHKIGIKVQGVHIQCFMDAGRVFNLEDRRNPRGYVYLATQKTATRFRNLKITDSKGHTLVDGVHNLEIVRESGDTHFNDMVREGTIWKGKVRQKANERDLPERDLKITIQKREGTRFEGEFWSLNSTQGMKIEGNIDAKGNITWRATRFLVQGFLNDDNLVTLVMGVVEGKQIRAYASFPRLNLVAEAIAKLED
jgi:hypothetical protein